VFCRSAISPVTTRMQRPATITRIAHPSPSLSTCQHPRLPLLPPPPPSSHESEGAADVQPSSKFHPTGGTEGRSLSHIVFTLPDPMVGSEPSCAGLWPPQPPSKLPPHPEPGQSLKTVGVRPKHPRINLIRASDLRQSPLAQQKLKSP